MDSVPLRAEPVLAAALKVTDPDPKLCGSEVIVSHPALLPAVHSQPAAVSTVIVVPPPPPAAPIDAEIGVTSKTHGVVGGGSAGFASWEMRMVRSAIAIDALRASPVLAPTVIVTAPGPVDPEVTVTQGASARAVHAQPASVVTLILAVPPESSKVWLVDETSNRHAAAS